VKGFKQVRLYLLQEVLEELQGVTQTLLPQIGLDDWLCEFAMERETQAGKVSPGLNVNIFKPGSDVQVKWESWSGGEGQRLRLIGAIALSQVLLRRAGVECDMLILDEPTRHLSPEGVAETIDFLIDLGVDHQVLYVDHQAIESRRFASTLIVRRDENGAKISRA
jgi:DNA repair exonuclease SbcCD ATPase subunit